MCQTGSEGLIILYRYRTVYRLLVSTRSITRCMFLSCSHSRHQRRALHRLSHTSSSMDALKSAGRAIIKSPGVPRHTWGTSKHESEYPAFISVYSHCISTAVHDNTASAAHETTWKAYMCPFTVFGNCLTVHIAFICLCIVWDVHFTIVLAITKYSIWSVSHFFPCMCERKSN